MIVFDFEIKEYDWKVFCYFGYKPKNAFEICEKLSELNCPKERIEEALQHLSCNSKERGLTYSDVFNRQSVLAIGASYVQTDEFNTLGHEVFHLIAHICDIKGLDFFGEEPCYLAGTIYEIITKNLNDYGYFGND